MNALEFAPMMANQKILEMEAERDAKLKNRIAQESPWFNIIKEALPLNANENESTILGQSVGAPALPPLPFTGNREPAAAMMPEDVQSYSTRSPQVFPGYGGLMDQLTKKQLESQRLQQEGINALQKRMEELQETPTKQGDLGRALALAADMWGGGGGMYSKAYEQVNPQMTEAQKQEALLKMEDMLRRSRGDLTQSEIDLLKAQLGYKAQEQKLKSKGFEDEAEIIKTPQGKKVEAAINFQQSLGRYKKLVEKYGTVLTGAERKPIDSAYADLKIKYKNAAELGALTGPDVTIIMEAVAPATGLRALTGSLYTGGKEGILASIKQLNDSANIDARTELESLKNAFGPGKRTITAWEQKLNRVEERETVPKVPPGTVYNGYKFKGGDPNNKNNWEKM